MVCISRSLHTSLSKSLHICDYTTSIAQLCVLGVCHMLPLTADMLAL